MGEEGSVSGTALIAASKYMYVNVGVWRGKGECVCVLSRWVGVCDCVGVGVIAWVTKGLCGWYSLNCCCKVCMCVGGSVGGVCGCGCDCVGEEECLGGTVLISALKYVCVRGECEGECVCDCEGVGVIAWVWKGVCGWYSLSCCCKVCMCVGSVGGVRVGATVWV